MIRWGVVGAGGIAKAFARDLDTLDNASIVAVASRTLSSAQAFATDFDVPHVLGDTQALVSHAEVDAVYVAAPHTAHYSIATAVIDAGKPVLCEKPLVTSVSDSEALLAHAASKGVLLTEALWSYYLPAWQQAMRWLHGGRIGHVHKLTADFGFDMRPYDPAKRVYNRDWAGGCLLDMGIYPLALVWQVFGRLPDSLQSVAGFAPNGVEDVFQSTLQYADACAIVGASFRTTLPNQAIIAGEAGWIEIPQFWSARECRLWRGDKLVDEFRAPRDTVGLHYEVSAFIDDMASGRHQSLVVSHDTSHQLMRLMASVRNSFG